MRVALVGRMRAHSKAVWMLFAALAVAFACGFAASEDAYASENARFINVVYDDSGSMDPSNAWCQAHYAMEVFASMLGPNDTLNVFTMSSAQAGSSAPDLVIKGSEGIEERVSRAHGQFSSESSTTTFYAGINAHDYFSQAPADSERWLVVLTDGEFTIVDDLNADGGGASTEEVAAHVNGYLAAWSDEGIKVEYVAMGSAAGTYLPTPKNNLSVRQIESAHILEGIIDECNRIFDRAVLPAESYDAGAQSLAIDIPMRKIVVFAQGKDVTVGSLEAEGRTCAPSAAQVRFTEQPHANPGTWWDGSFDDSLQGVVATFEEPEGFASGAAKLPISGAVTTSIYYEPYVAIGLLLTDSEGNEMLMRQDAANEVQAGTYSTSFQLLDPFKGSPVESSLIQSVLCSGAIDYGEGRQLAIGDGQDIELTEGKGVLTANAVINGDVRVEQSYGDLTVAPKALGVEVDQAPSGPLSVDALGESEPFLVRVTKDGAPLTEEEWARTTVTAASPAAERHDGIMGFYLDDKGIGCTAEKGAEVSTYVVKLAPYEGDVSRTLTGEVPVEISADYQTEVSHARGSATATASIEPRPALDSLLDWIMGHPLQIASLLGLLVFLFYLFKRLTRKNLPDLEAEVKAEGTHNTATSFVERPGTLARWFSPFAQKGHIDIDYPSRCSATVPLSLELIATGGGRVTVTNFDEWRQASASCGGINFRGVPISESTKAENIKLGGTSMVYEGRFRTDSSRIRVEFTQ